MTFHPQEHRVSRRTRRTAFTLIELLAVVAVIAILAALIFPVVGKILEQSAITRSMNNLRQIGISISGYVMDSDGSLPNKIFAAPKGNWIADAYMRVYGEDWPGFVPFDTGENLRRTILFSPVLKATEPKPWRSYGWNGRLQVGSEEPPKLAKISRPSQAILCGDSLGSSNIDYKNVSYRNNGKAFMLMGDFHVQQFNPNEIPANFTDPMWRPFP